VASFYSVRGSTFGCNQRGRHPTDYCLLTATPLTIAREPIDQ
jgi:hypothetical protein